MREHALAYASAGYPVFPCHNIKAVGLCTCGKKDCPSPGKHPRTKNGLLAATTDPKTLTQWWDKYPDANIGYRPPQGLVIMDVDNKPGKPGTATLAGLCAFSGALPKTPTAITGSGGGHYHFKCDRPLRNAVELLPGIDVRTHDGYILLPPSLHISGVRYGWAPGCDPSSVAVVDMPDWLYAALTQNSATERRVPLDVSVEVPDGSRNTTLAREMGRLRQTGYGRDAMLAAGLALNEQICSPPLDADEVEKIVNSIARYPKGEFPATAEMDFTPIIEKELRTKTLCASDVEVKDVAWLWRHVFVQGGLNSVQGLAGIGKTFLLCAVSAAVSTGGRVQSVTGSMEKLPQGNVLYLSGDDDVSTTIVPRLKEFGANLDNIHFATQGSLPPIGSAEFAQLFEAVKPSFVIVDTLQHFLPAKTDLNSANSTTVALQPLKVLAERYNCSVVVIQHISKISASGNGGYSVNFGIGSAAVNGLFRSVYTLGRLKGDDGKASVTRALSPSKTNLVAGDPPSILFDLSLEKGFEWAGIDGNITAEQLYNPVKNPAHRPNDLVERVKDEIHNILSTATEPVRSTELQERIIDATGCSERTYHTARKSLGVVSSKMGDAWYALLPKTSDN